MMNEAGFIEFDLVKETGFNSSPVSKGVLFRARRPKVVLNDFFWVLYSAPAKGCPQSAIPSRSLHLGDLPLMIAIRRLWVLHQNLIKVKEIPYRLLTFS